MQVIVNNGMSCQVRQCAKNVSERQGKYLDLKAHPERASELPEAKDWPALGAFVEAINRNQAFATFGCMATGATPGGYEAAYVDVAFSDAKLSASCGACRQLMDSLCELHDPQSQSGFTLELCDSHATLPNGKQIESVRLWLKGSRSAAEAAFPAILARLAQQDPSEYAAAGEADFLKRAEERRKAVRFLVFCSALFTLVGVIVGWLASGYGWLAAGSGFVCGFLALPVLGVLVVTTCFYWMNREFRRHRQATPPTEQ